VSDSTVNSEFASSGNPQIDALIKSARDHRDRFLSDLVEWLEIPSISSDSARKADVRKACDWVS
jgi:hypothetical protein